MFGILADANCDGHLQRLRDHMRRDWREDVWMLLNITTKSLADVNLHLDSSDALVWRKCQDEHLVLLTANRNEEGEDSLQAVINNENTLECLPVITLAES